MLTFGGLFLLPQKTSASTLLFEYGTDDGLSSHNQIIGASSTLFSGINFVTQTNQLITSIEMRTDCANECPVGGYIEIINGSTGNILATSTQSVSSSYSGTGYGSIQTWTFNYEIPATIPIKFVYEKVGGGWFVYGAYLKAYSNTNQSLTFTAPTNNSVNSGDISHWNIELQSGNGYCGEIKVKYGTSTNNLNNVDTDSYLCYGSATTDTRYVVKSKRTPGLYYAQAFLYNETNTLIATSTQISFTSGGNYVINTGNALPTYGDLVSSSTVISLQRWNLLFDNVDCSAYDDASLFSSSTVGLIKCYTKKYFFKGVQFFVTPHDASTQYIKGSFDALKEDFPFNIVFQTINTFENNVKNSSGTNLTINYGGKINMSFNMLTPTTLADTVGSSTATQVMNAETNIIWIIMGIAMIAIIL